MIDSTLTLELIRTVEFPDLLDRLEDDSDDNIDAALWYRYRYRREDFCVAMFPDRFTDAFSELHRDLLEREKVRWEERREVSYEAMAAPRGSAKSTIESFADVLHDIVYGFEAFVGIISTSFDLSEALVTDVYNVVSEPDSAPEFHRMYGPFKVRGSKTDFVVWCPSADVRRGTRIKAYSMGGACRGHKHGGVRFTKWILDDAERSDRVQSPDTRDDHEKYIDADILKSGGRYTIVRFIGTILHPDSVLARKLDGARSPEWERKVYRSIKSWPDEIEGLWERCREIWVDLELGTAKIRKRAARAFYDLHRKAMDAGASVLWPSGEPLFELMVQYWANKFAFFAEKQNEPGKSGTATFDVDRFRWVEFDGEYITVSNPGKPDRKIALARCQLAVWWDPIPYGKKGKGKDSAGFAVVAKGPNGGKYVLESKLLQAAPQRQWDALFVFMRRYPFASFGYENNNGKAEDAEDFVRQFEDVQHAHPQITLKGYQSKGPKPPRIASIQPATENGHIRFARGGIPDATLDQFRYSPHGRHDDGPDSIERACWLLDRGELPTVQRTRF